MRLVLALLVAASLPGCSSLGGASVRKPHEVGKLSWGARRMVKKAWKGVDASALMDHHTHVVGLGVGGTGAFVHPDMQSWWSPMRRIKFGVYASAAAIEDLERADQEYVERLLSLVRNLPKPGRHLLLAFDKHYLEGGEVSLEHTEFYVPNEYVFSLAAAHPEYFVPAISVHPYRKDAVAELERWAKRGARFVKWLPNAMGIDPSHPKTAPFYAAMRRHGMVLLAHAGEEKAVDADEAQRFGNPLHLRVPLDAGVKVVVAHCASLGQNPDLDDPELPLVDNFDLFLRLMDDEKYQGRVFGELSATLQANRLARPIVTLLDRADLHPRLINGSDYPLPAINVVVRTSALANEGLISGEELKRLNELYDLNPLLFDFVAKRTIRSPNTGNRFPASVFQAHPDLPVFTVRP